MSHTSPFIISKHAVRISSILSINEIRTRILSLRFKCLMASFDGHNMKAYSILDVAVPIFLWVDMTNIYPWATLFSIFSYCPYLIWWIHFFFIWYLVYPLKLQGQKASLPFKYWLLAFSPLILYFTGRTLTYP